MYKKTKRKPKYLQLLVRYFFEKVFHIARNCKWSLQFLISVGRLLNIFAASSWNVLLSCLSPNSNFGALSDLKLYEPTTCCFSFMGNSVSYIDL